VPIWVLSTRQYWASARKIPRSQPGGEHTPIGLIPKVIHGGANHDQIVGNAKSGQKAGYTRDSGALEGYLGHYLAQTGR